MSLINWIDLPSRGDARGALVAIEGGNDLPFEIKRVYYIYATQQGVSRGFHAHKKLRQVAVCVAGSCEMVLDDGVEKTSFLLNDPSRAIVIDPLIWHEMHHFSPDCILVVFADDAYDESDYIRQYASFLETVKR